MTLRPHQYHSVFHWSWKGMLTLSPQHRSLNVARKGTKKSTSKKRPIKRHEHAVSVAVGDKESASRAEEYREKWNPRGIISHASITWDLLRKQNREYHEVARELCLPETRAGNQQIQRHRKAGRGHVQAGTPRISIGRTRALAGPPGRPQPPARSHRPAHPGAAVGALPARRGSGCSSQTIRSHPIR